MLKATFTIKEISALCGFSVSTVSKALNDKNDISLETREAIKKIAKKFNYVPNNYAVALRMKKTKSIAVVLPEVTQKHFSMALGHLQTMADDFGYGILFYQTFNSRLKETNYINRLNDGTIAGIIVISDQVNAKTIYSKTVLPTQLLIVNRKLTSKTIKQQSFCCINSLITHA